MLLKNFLTGNITIAPKDQRIILDLIHSELIKATNIERYGELTNESIARYDNLREIFCRLADNLGKSTAILPYEWISLGITNRVSLGQILELADPNKIVDTDDLYISQKAQYLLRKMKR